MDRMTIILHEMTASAPFSRYLPIEDSLKDWGVYVLDAGFETVPAGETYPLANHPSSYLFTREKGRSLDEYQIVYITAGKGNFEWGDGQRAKVSAGDVYILYPGLWHRYRPEKKLGWDEHWIGFNGKYAQQLMEKFFSEKSPVIKVGLDAELRNKFRSVARLMEERMPRYRQRMAGELVACLALIRALSLQENQFAYSMEEKMNEARHFILQHAYEQVDLQSLAVKLGLSYSRFRTLFREHTGQSPRQYQLDIRLNFAKVLLRESGKSVSEIAEELGFASVYYFSRFFKEKTGISPSNYCKEK